MATQLAPHAENTAVALTPEGERFALRQRQARMFATSPLVPDHLRKGTAEQALANCYIALTLAEAMGEVPLIVMQNIHVVNGKAGFATQYMIARANNSGIFRGRIDWRIDKSDPKNLSITAFAVLKDTGQEVSVTVDMAMAAAEQWTKNPKYRTMPEVMLRYRSAAFLVRFYAPDVMLGYQSTEEIEDVGSARGPDLNATPLSAAMLVDQAAGASEPMFADAVSVIDGETGEVIEVEADDAEVDSQFDAAHPSDSTHTDETAVAAEVAADEVQGEGQAEDEQPLWKVAFVAVRQLIEAAKDQKSWLRAEAEFLKVSGGLPDIERDDLDRQLVAKRNELQGAKA